MVAVVIVKIAAAVILAVATEIIGAGTPVAATITEMVVVAVTALAAILQIPTI